MNWSSLDWVLYKLFLTDSDLIRQQTEMWISTAKLRKKGRYGTSGWLCLWCKLVLQQWQLLTCPICLSTHTQKPLSSFIHCTFRRGNVRLPLPLPLTKKPLPPPTLPAISTIKQRQKKLNFPDSGDHHKNIFSPSPVNFLSYQLFVPSWKWLLMTR